jgi:shikimate dehydrogenase
MRLFGLIGYPLTHSFSKKFFSEKFDQEGIADCRYELFSIPAIDQLTEILAAHPDLAGLNVTIPYKEQVLPFLQAQDEVVNEIGACNCILVHKGHLKGFNTDVTGFERSLGQKLLPHHRRALVLGTGGASKAVRYVLRKAGIEYLSVSRTPRDGEIGYADLTATVMKEHQLIINTTPVGTYPNVEHAPPIPYDLVTSKHYLYDLVYNPEKTIFLQRGEEKGAATKNGYDMLVVQAEESWRIWNG